MAAPSLDNELMHLWPKLTPVQKKSILTVIKCFTEPEERVSIEQYNHELEEAEKSIKAGHFITQEDLEKEMEKC